MGTVQGKGDPIGGGHHIPLAYWCDTRCAKPHEAYSLMVGSYVSFLIITIFIQPTIEMPRQCLSAGLCGSTDFCRYSSIYLKHNPLQRTILHINPSH